MIQEKQHNYIMEDAREADRLASKVDAEDFIKNTWRIMYILPAGMF